MSLAAPVYLHPGQRMVLNDGHRFKVVVAGRRWGKTVTSRTAIIKAAREPRQLIWYVAPTYRMARGIMWNELLEVIPKEWIVKKHETLLTITLINNTRIELKGADKPDTLRGVGLHNLIIDEAQDIKKDTWVKVLRPTLATTRGKVLIIGTPKAFNWLYEVYMDGQRGDTYKAKDGKVLLNSWKSWQFPTRTSPFIPAEEIEAAKTDMDEKSFRQEFEASFETMSGRVYYAFDRNVHVKSTEFNPKLPIWVGQDFNIDPMSSVIMQPQDSGEIWVIDECVMYGSNTQEVADEIGRRYHRFFKQLTMYPDPAGNNRQGARGESDIQILRESGLKNQKFKRKHPPVADRVNSVNRILKDANGMVRLRVDPKARFLIKALEETIYKPGTRDVDKKLGVEHPADAIGYCLNWEFPVKRFDIKGISI
jgi:hypothetical protein